MSEWGGVLVLPLSVVSPLTAPGSSLSDGEGHSSSFMVLPGLRLSSGALPSVRGDLSRLQAHVHGACHPQKLPSRSGSPSSRTVDAGLR